jgi:oligopeptide transport system permease protein
MKKFSKDKILDVYKVLVGVLIATGLVVSVMGLKGLFATILWSALGILIFSGFIALVIKQHLLPYLLKRFLEAAATLFVIVTLVFLMLRLMPGGPFDSERAMPAEVMANIAAKYKLDAPLSEQYLHYLGNLAKGDMGESFKYLGRPVSSIIADTFPVSLQLGVYALILSYLIGIPLGVIAASKHNTWMDSGSMFLAMGGVSLPSFLVASIFILIFSFQFQILPPALWEGPLYYILPVVTLGIRPAAIIARLTRSSVLDVIGSDFVRTARAKGLPEKAVLFKHVLRNSLIPVLTYSGPLIADIISGAFIIEIIFAVPGMGRHMILSVTNRDYPLVLGVALLFSVLLVVSNLLVDIFYAVVDPRIKLAT